MATCQVLPHSSYITNTKMLIIKLISFKMLWVNNLCTFLDVLTITMKQSWICECIYEACYTEWFLKCAMKNETWNGFAIPEKQTEPENPHFKFSKWNTLKLPLLGKPPDCLFNSNPANVIGWVRSIMLEFFYCLNKELIPFLFWKTHHYIESLPSHMKEYYYE